MSSSDVLINLMAYYTIEWEALQAGEGALRVLFFPANRVMGLNILLEYIIMTQSMFSLC